MTLLFAVSHGVHVLGFPMLAIMALFVSKLTIGPASKLADRGFIGMLVLQGVLTMRAAVALDDTWLIHVLTLMLLIIGAVVVPAVGQYDSETSQICDRNPANQP